MNINQNITLDQTPNLKINLYENTILSLFRLQVENNPHKVAVKMGEKNLTYQELDKISDKIASALILKGLKEDTPIGILLPRSLEFIVSIFGVLKAGGGYVPMNPSDGAERLTHILTNCDCPFLLTQSQFLNPKINSLNTQLLEIEIGESGLIGFDDVPFYPKRIKPENLAYIIYTSGTTGLPKGAMIEHQNIYWLITNYVPKITPMDRILQSMSLTCDASVVEIFPALCNGATLVLWEEFSSALLKTEKITHICMTPSMTEIINPTDCNYLQHIVIGGEKLTSDIVKKFPPQIKIFNGYGPTECTVACSCTMIGDPTRIHIGGKLNQAELYVVDSDFKLCSTNQVGELLIGGKGVGRGYWNRSDLTLEKFLKNPFGSEMVYRTGDLVKWNQFNELEYMGRADRQVKVRGFRLELDGVEKIINQFPGVTGSYLVLNGHNLLAYITPKEIDQGALQIHLEKSLPKHAIPFKYIFLNKFPLNAAGKVDKNELPPPIFSDEKKDYLPITSMEQKIEALWKEVLSFNSGRLSLKDNFFDLGGNSLHAIKLINIINDTFRLEIPLQFIYQYSFLGDFVESFNQAEKEKRSRVKVKPPLYNLLIDTLKCLPSTLWFYFLFAIPSLLLISVFFFSPWIVIGFVALEFLFEKYGNLPRSNILRKLKIALHFTNFKYKSVKIIQEAPVENFPRTNFLIAPHGISDDHMIPIEKLLLTKKIRFQVTYNETLFKLPLSKTLYSLLGGTPAKKESYFRAEKENLSLLVTPGDGYELFYLDEPSTIALKDNKHFFKYALETGTPLTPIYVFNYNKTFKFFRHFQQERISIFEKNKSVIIQPFYGRWFLPIPFKVELNAVIGTPLPVQKIENPTWQEVETLFNRYTSHVGDLYKKHTGANDPPLKIV